MTLLNLEELIATMARYGDLAMFTNEKGKLCSVRFTIGNYAKTYLNVEAYGCSSHLQALNMINEHFYLSPSMPILREGEIFLGDKVFGAIQERFTTEHLSIHVDNRMWSVSIDYERKDLGAVPPPSPGILFSYRDYDGHEDFSALMMKVYSRFKIPAEGIILGPGGMSPD